MRCKRCGTNNPGRADYCYSCGQILEKSRNGNSILLIILIMVIIIAIFTIGLAVKVINDRNRNNYTGNTPFDIQPTAQATNTAVPAEKVITTPPEQKTESLPQLPATDPDPAYTEAPTRKPTTSPSEKKELFLDRAHKIQEYSDNYIDESSSQQTLNTESGIVFEKWDDLLNEVYDYLKETLPKSEFEALKKDEIEWVAVKEQAIKEQEEFWGSGTGRAYACNTVGILYTKERCYYLISLID